MNALDFANTYSEHDWRTCPYCMYANAVGLSVCDNTGNRHDGESMQPDIKPDMGVGHICPSVSNKMDTKSSSDHGNERY